MFYIIDKEGDGNGFISQKEFDVFLKRLGKNNYLYFKLLYFVSFLCIYIFFYILIGMELSSHRINEIFASVKNKSKKSK